MSEAWPKVMLGELLQRSEEQVSIQPSLEYKEITIKLWGKGVVSRGVVLGSKIAAQRRYRVRSGQFILSRIDARNGAFGVVPKELDGAVASNDFPVFYIREDRLSSSYLGWMCRTFNFVQQCQKSSEGTTNRVRIKEAKFLAQEIYLPPLGEQHRIVARINEIAGFIREGQELREMVNKEKEAVITSLHLQLSADRVTKVKDIIQLDEDYISVKGEELYPQVGIRSFGGGMFPKAAVSGMETTYNRFIKLFAGALVLSQVKGWEGAVAVCPEDLHGWFVSPEYRTFRCVPSEVRPGYLSSLVKTEWFWGRLAEATRGVGARRERTRPEQFLGIELPMPTVENQLLGERIFSKFGELNTLHGQSFLEMEALMPSILDRAFKGEL